MASTIKLKTVISGDVADVQSLVLHPMETGSRVDPDMGLIPAHHITQLTFTNNDKVVMAANFSTAVSANPYLRFKFRGAKAGDTFKVSWVDNLGDSDELEKTL